MNQRRYGCVIVVQMFARKRHSGAEVSDRVFRAADRWFLGVFYVHFDEIDAG
jgi:hypothetical protein